jgi:hypothetical protein
MRAPFRSLLALAFPVAFAVAVACSSDTYDNQCAQFGGACVASEAECNGSLPYSCTVGVCCYPFPDAGTPAPTPGADSSTPPSRADATGSDATVTHETGTPDVATSNDTSTPGIDAQPEATVPDQAAPVDSGTDAGAGDTGVDSGTPDASTKDATADVATHDAGDAAKPDAAASCPGFAPPTTVDLCTGCLVTDPSCQANGCFGGYYCKTSTLTCVKPSKVTCDAGT